ncbi:MAG: GNAT family N-acetyltransferase [Candidatus Omnitrophota bacterium]
MIKRKLTRFIAAALAVSLLWQNVSQACPNGPGFLRTMAYTEREEGVDLNAREPVRIIKLSNGEELAVFPMDKSFAHDADYSQKIINVRNLIPGADWDVEDLSSAFDTYKRNRIHRFSFVLVNEQSDIVGLIIAYERDRIKADNAIPEGKDGPHLYIQSLSIKDDERYRRKGLAQKLIECSIESYAERKKASRLSELNVAIQSYQQNTPACTLYGEKMGFELIGTRTYDFVPEPSNPYYENFKGKWVDNVYFASAKDLLIKKPMAKVSHFFEERRVLAVATSAILKAIGVVVVGFVTQAIHPAQITFWVYAFDFIIISGILFILGFYKSSSGKPLGIFRDITRTWRILNNRHKAHLGIFSFFYLAASLGTYFVFPHVTSAMIMILMQMSLATALPLTVLILGERKGWSRKLISLGIIVALVSFMAFFESMANPAFLRNISWIVKGVFIGSLWGIPAVILRKIFQEIRHPDKEGRSFYKEHEKRRILPFIPGM